VLKYQLDRTIAFPCSGAPYLQFALHVKWPGSYLTLKENNMVVEITSDSDLPKSLNTPTKQQKKARQLASSHAGIPAIKARGAYPKGFFSRTVLVELQDGEEVVIQFRPERLDIEPFELARKVLGPVVPEIKPLQDEELDREGIWAYWMTRMPGKTWLEGFRGKDPTYLVTINRSLGRILSRGFVADNSEQVVERQLRPHLNLILTSKDDQVRRFHDTAADLLGKLDQLKMLPLFISHFDLNEVNVMIDDDCEVSGIIDWELSVPLPFGMGFCRIHTTAGEFSEGKFYMPPDFENAEKGFWQEIYDGVPESVRKLLDTDPDAVQTAVMLGTLLDAFQLDEGKLGDRHNHVVLEALPKFFSYRIPFLRGSDPPYSK